MHSCSRKRKRGKKSEALCQPLNHARVRASIDAGGGGEREREEALRLAGVSRANEKIVTLCPTILPTSFVSLTLSSCLLSCSFVLPLRAVGPHTVVYLFPFSSLSLASLARLFHFKPCVFALSLAASLSILWLSLDHLSLSLSLSLFS